jgi:hypothetical protein
MKKVVVVLKLAKMPIPQKIAKARFIVTSMTGNASFETPSPTLDIISTNINALEAAYLAASGGGVDDTAAMHSKEFLLEVSLKSLAAYVEGIANTNLGTAESVALSSGMDIKGAGTHQAKEFNVKPTGNPGEVKMATKSAPRCTYMWQMTSDPTVATGWITIGQATQANFIKSGLTSGARYYFRVATVGKEGQEPWSNVVNTIVL